MKINMYKTFCQSIFTNILSLLNMSSTNAYYIKNACPEDYTNICRLFLTARTQYFGHHRKNASLEDIFFNHHVTHRILIQFSATKPCIIGYAEVSNAPNIPALPNDLWLDFLNFHYCCNFPLTPTNTCFLNKFVYNNNYNPEMLKQLLSEIFYRENKVRYIVVVECPDFRRYSGKDVRNYNCLEAFSMILYPKCFSVITCANTQKLHIIMRDSLLPQMSYRRALPEDNDDIVELVNQDRPDLKKQLGEYYIAEELLSNAKSLLIVTEINHLTAGFIWLNDNINLLALLENYDLQAFGNLLKFNNQERFKEKILYVTNAIKRPLDKLFTTESVKQIYKSMGEVANMSNVSNLSICSHYIESHEGRILAINEKRFIRELILNRLELLNKQMKSYDYYVKIRRQQLGFYFNIPDGETNATYDSRTNAFIIQLYGLMGSYDYRLIFQFLMTSFAAFPNKDYCLLSVSVNNHVTPALFEMLKYFIRVPPRPDCRSDEQLFITHRSAIYGDISVYPVRTNDRDDITNMIMQETNNSPPVPKRAARSRIFTLADRISFKSYISQHSDSYEELTSNQYDLEQVTHILKNIFEDPFTIFKCFTIRCGDSTRSVDDNKLVGFAIVRPFHLNSCLKKHYLVNNEEEFQNLFKAELVILRLHPFFAFQADFIFQELARQTNYFYFYYFRPNNHYYLSNDLVASMQPLEPRRIKKLWFNNLGTDFKAEISASVFNSHADKFMTNTNLLNDRFVIFTHNLHPSTYFGNSRNIVILGFTDICKAFLRLMIFSWHNLSKNSQATTNCLPQLNITVICSPGVMMADHEHAFECKTCSKETGETCWVNFNNSDAFIRDVCERLDVRTWIRFVSGKIQTINAATQLIKLETECEIYYETLLLMCGTEFGVPQSIFKDTHTPANYSHINNRFDKILLYHKLQILCNDLPKNIKKSIIVYGAHVRAFEFINFLLKHDIKGNEVHLVMPYAMDNLQMGLMLNNSAQDIRIEAILRDMFEDLDVKIYENMILSSYTLHDDDKNLKDLSFKKLIGSEELTLECDLFVSFYEVFLPQPLLEIFKNANIDTDHNSVLVNDNYRTSVANIYAMGNFIKHTTEPNHQYRFVSPQEAAEKIINVLGLIDIKEKAPMPEKKFSKSAYFQAQLPLDYLFIKVTTPKRYLANHLDNEYGFPLITYYEGDFSRVRLNEHGMVEEIVLVTQKKKDFDFLKFFCGRHELLLNNLKSRWYLKDIVNFIDFFQEPWTELLMHNQFENLRLLNKYLILHTAKDILKKDIQRNDRLKLMISYCQDLGITSQVEYALLEFLRDHREDFCADIPLPKDFAEN